MLEFEIESAEDLEIFVKRPIDCSWFFMLKGHGNEQILILYFLASCAARMIQESLKYWGLQIGQHHMA